MPVAPGPYSSDFAAEIPADPVRLSLLRKELDQWLVELGVGESDIASVEIAVLEAATKSVEHAYPDGAGHVRVEGTLDNQGRICMTVIDHGRWRPTRVGAGAG